MAGFRGQGPGCNRQALPCPRDGRARRPPSPGSCRSPSWHSSARSPYPGRRQLAQAAASIPPSGREPWSVPGRDQHQVGEEGREQLTVRADGVPLERDVVQSSHWLRSWVRLGQPGQASRRASELHQGGDALAVGHLGGPQQHPAHSQDPQPGPGGAEADIYYNAIADDGMACHGTQSTGRAPGLAAGAGPYPWAESHQRNGWNIRHQTEIEVKVPRTPALGKTPQLDVMRRPAVRTRRRGTAPGADG